MRSAPLFPVAAGMIAGIWLDRTFFVGPFVYVLLFVVVTLATLPRRVRTSAGWLLVGLASACVGDLLHFDRQRVVHSSGIERFTHENRRIARLRGTVDSPPRVLGKSAYPFARWNYRSDRTVFLLKAQSLEGKDDDIPVTGRVRVVVDEVLLDLHEDEPVELFGWLYPLKPPRNPGSFDWASFQRRQGVVAGFSCRQRENVRRLASREPSPHRPSLVYRFRSKVRGLLTDDLVTGAEEESSLLEAMILGHRSRLDRRLNDVFVRAGCIHFLAVSGIHVVIVMFFARLLCRLLMRGPRTSTWAMLVAVILYAVLAEPRPPILRASVLAILYCLAKLIGRERACLNWISASAIVLIAIQPETIFDVGFQLSFAACLGVSYLTPALLDTAMALKRIWRKMVRGDVLTTEEEERIASLSRSDHPVARAGRWLWRFIRRYAVLGMAVTAGAWLAAWPIVAWHFHRLQPWGAPNSFLVLPFVTLLMGLGFVKLFATAVAPAVGAMLGVWLVKADSLLIRCVEFLGHLPGADETVSQPPWWMIATYFAFLLAFLWPFRQARDVMSPYLSGSASPPPSRSSGPSQSRWHWSSLLPSLTPWPWRNPEHHARSGVSGALCLVSLLLFVVASVAWRWPPAASDRLAVTVLSVGSGSATVIELPDGSTVLYDLGSRTPYDVGHRTVVPFLRHRWIRRVDRVYLSHPNLDHFSGVPGLLDEVDTGPIVINAYFEPHSASGSPSRHLLSILAKWKHPVEVLDLEKRSWTMGGVTFEALWPPPGLDESVGDNDTSTVLRLSYAGRSILLTGDIEDRAQRALLDRGDVHADVLVLPHHGSVRPSTRAFLSAVSAQVLVRSTNERTAETINGLNAIVGTTPLYNTADVGAVRVILSRDGIDVGAARQPCCAPLRSAVR